MYIFALTDAFNLNEKLIKLFDFNLPYTSRTDPDSYILIHFIEYEMVYYCLKCKDKV